jgi:plasmid stabilization system protein ParE
MALKIYWTDFAKSELQKIFDYHIIRAGERNTNRLIDGIIQETEPLCEQPLIGQIEELLSHRAETFRYLVHRNYKIVYWLNREKNHVEIVDVFDTRQNPTKMNRV